MAEQTVEQPEVPPAGPERTADGRPSLLDADPFTGEYPTSLRGGVVTDPDAISTIHAWFDYMHLPLWRRLFTRRPEGW